MSQISIIRSTISFLSQLTPYKMIKVRRLSSSGRDSATLAWKRPKIIRYWIWQQSQVRICSMIRLLMCLTSIGVVYGHQFWVGSLMRHALLHKLKNIKCSPQSNSIKIVNRINFSNAWPTVSIHGSPQRPSRRSNLLIIRAPPTKTNPTRRLQESGRPSSCRRWRRRTEGSSADT